MQTIVVLVILCAAGKVYGGCSGQCTCPPTPPSCQVGVSLVLDECGCCKVCAQQFNQECGPDKPCDHIKGLHCHLGAGGDSQHGLCRADAQGRPCEFGGRMYQHGEDFQPSCEHQCSCMDGVVGCMPLCPHRVPLPTWSCSKPHLKKPPGQCCEKWVCEDDNHISEDPHEVLPPQVHTNRIDNLLNTGDGYQNRGGDAFQEWASLPMSRVPFPSSECFPQTTDWSECSHSCGFGVSSRVTNSNPQCKLVRETRLCKIQECGVVTVGKKGKKCRRTQRSRESEHISFGGCTTVRKYRPKTCGSCVDGRCCRPSETRTVRLRFHCPDGESITRNIMWIERCSCSQIYCSMNTDSSAPSVSLHNDIHTFSH
ncbi:cellular communication network factor 1, like 2 [Trichomycterus rosablanca]|uniref:cellular communication network factor 1, like 2 n=1 Tax=Trichomycterus rosablanca TaxID=2290929 RepID=UPI002F34F038